MIDNKQELERYLKMDKYALGKEYRRPHFFGDEEWKYEICLRKYEYFINTRKSIFNRVSFMFYRYKHHRLSIKYGFSIPANVFGAGLRINHIGGGIIVNPKSKIGEWCDIHQGVNIGQNVEGLCPHLGSNVYVGPGAKIFGDVYIADDVMIGANAVVTASIKEKGAVAVGIPARISSVKEKNPLHREMK